MLRYFRFKKSSTTNLLGRWGTIINEQNNNTLQREKSIEFNSDWSNHDHCGGEVCQNIAIIKNIDKDDKNDKNDKEIYDSIKHELPHIL